MLHSVQKLDNPFVSWCVCRIEKLVAIGSKKELCQCNSAVGVADVLAFGKKSTKFVKM